MWLMLQQDRPDDYVVATGLGASVRDFAQFAFEQVGLDYKNYVLFDQRYIRPAEVDTLIGNPLKAKNNLGWIAKTYWQSLAKLMVQSDLDNHGLKIG